MEFPDLGVQCSLATCRQLDFLPFVCQACGDAFCGDHWKRSEHGCTATVTVEGPAAVMCPVCSAVFVLEEDADGVSPDPDALIDGHLERGCPPDEGIRPSRVRCAKDRCKKKIGDPFLCHLCHRPFCVDHRLEFDHECSRNVAAAAAARASFKSRLKRKCTCS